MKLESLIKLVIDYRGKTPLKLGLNWDENGEYIALSARNIKTGNLINLNTCYRGNKALYNAWMKDEVIRNDILITSEAPFGETYIWESDEKIILSQRLFCLRPNVDKVIPKFLYYSMCSKYFQDELISRATGSTAIGLRQPELLSCDINILSFVEQQHIVNTIGTVDDLIEEKKKEIALKYNLLIRLLDQCETDSITTFGSIFETFNGGVFQSKHYVIKSMNKLITIKNVDDNGFNSDTVSYIDSAHTDTKFLLNVGDIVLTMTGNIGRTGIVDENNCYLNQRVLKITSISKSYLLAFLIKYKKEIILLGKGTAQKNLSLEDLKSLPIMNTEDEINNFKKYDVIFDSIVNDKLILKKLNKIKLILLNKYF